MPKFRVQDPETGVTLVLQGDSAPTEQELNDIFEAPRIAKQSLGKVMDVTRTASTAAQLVQAQEQENLAKGQQAMDFVQAHGVEQGLIPTLAATNLITRGAQAKAAGDQLRAQGARMPGEAMLPETGEQRTTYGGPPKAVASFGETMQEPWEEYTRPRITLPKATIEKGDSLPVAVGKEIWNVASGLPEFFSSPLGLTAAVGAEVAPAATSLYFTYDMMKSLGDQAIQSYANWDQMDTQQKRAAVVDMVATGAFAAAAGKHAREGIHNQINPARRLAKAIDKTLKYEGLQGTTGGPKYGFVMPVPGKEQVGISKELGNELLKQNANLIQGEAPLTAAALKDQAALDIPKAPQSVSEPVDGVPIPPKPEKYVGEAARPIPELPTTEPPTPKGGEKDASKTEKPETSSLLTLERKPADREAEVKAEAGTAQQTGTDQEVTPNVRPAIRLMPAEQGIPGKIVAAERKPDGTWETHNELGERLGLEMRDVDRRIFIDEKGNELSRVEAAQATGLPTEVSPGELHSTDVNKAIEAKAEAEQATKPTLSELQAKFEREKQELLERNLAKIPNDATAIRLRNPEGKEVLVTPDPVEKGKWRVTWFTQEGEPWGHGVLPTREQAIQDALGIYGTGTYGPPHVLKGYEVVEAKAPEKPPTPAAEQPAVESVREGGGEKVGKGAGVSVLPSEGTANPVLVRENAVAAKPTVETPQLQRGIHFVKSDADLAAILEGGFKPGEGMGQYVSFYHEGQRPSDFGVGRKRAVIIEFEKGKGGSPKYEGSIPFFGIKSVREATPEEIQSWGKKTPATPTPKPEATEAKPAEFNPTEKPKRFGVAALTNDGEIWFRTYDNKETAERDYSLARTGGHKKIAYFDGRNFESNQAVQDALDKRWKGEGEKTTAAPTEKKPTKAALIEQLIGPKPEGGVERVEARVRWEQDKKRYAKLTVDELSERVRQKQESDAQSAKLNEATTQLFPEIQKVADDAGANWRSALRKYAESKGVTYYGPPDATKGDTVYAIARKIAGREQAQPIPPRVVPQYGMDIRAEAKRFNVPEDFWYEGKINPKYRTPEFDAAEKEEASWVKSQSINAPQGRRQARERLQAAYKDVVAKARASVETPKPAPQVEPQSRFIPQEFIKDRDFLTAERERILQDIDDWRSGKRATPGQPASGQNYQLTMRTEVATLDQRLAEVNKLLKELPEPPKPQPKQSKFSGIWKLSDNELREWINKNLSEYESQGYRVVEKRRLKEFLLSDLNAAREGLKEWEALGFGNPEMPLEMIGSSAMSLRGEGALSVMRNQQEYLRQRISKNEQIISEVNAIKKPNKVEKDRKWLAEQQIAQDKSTLDYNQRGISALEGMEPERTAQIPGTFEIKGAPERPAPPTPEFKSQLESEQAAVDAADKAQEPLWEAYQKAEAELSKAKRTYDDEKIAKAERRVAKKKVEWEKADEAKTAAQRVLWDLEERADYEKADPFNQWVWSAREAWQRMPKGPEKDALEQKILRAVEEEWTKETAKLMSNPKDAASAVSSIMTLNRSVLSRPLDKSNQISNLAKTASRLFEQRKAQAAAEDEISGMELSAYEKPVFKDYDSVDQIKEKLNKAREKSKENRKARLAKEKAEAEQTAKDEAEAKQRAIDLQAKGKLFWRWIGGDSGEGKWDAVEAKPVTVSEVPNAELFIYKNEGAKPPLSKWVLVEKTTGLSVGYGDTQTGAIEDFKAKIAGKPPERFYELVKSRSEGLPPKPEVKPAAEVAPKTLSEEQSLVQELSKIGTELAKLRKDLDYRPNDAELKKQWQALFKDYDKKERRLAEILGPKDVPPVGPGVAEPSATKPETPNVLARKIWPQEMLSVIEQGKEVQADIDRSYMPESDALKGRKMTLVTALVNRLQMGTQAAIREVDNLLKSKPTLIQDLMNGERVSGSKVTEASIPDSIMRNLGYDKVGRYWELPKPEGTPEIEGMGGAVPGEFVPPSGTSTGIKNAAIDAQRAERGEAPILSEARRAIPEVYNQTMALLDRDPEYQDRLVFQLREDPRTLTPVEEIAMLQRETDLRNEYNKATVALRQAYEDGRTDDIARLRLQVADWNDKLNDLEAIMRKVGTAWGISGRFRQLMMKEDYSLDAVQRRIENARGARLDPTNEADAKLIEQLRKDVEEYQKRLAAYEESQKADAERLAQAQRQAEELAAQQRANETELEASRRQRRFAPRVLEYAERVVTGWERRAERAKNELLAMLDEPGAMSGPLNPEVIDRLAIMGLAKLGRAALSAAEFADSFIAELGDRIRPYFADNTIYERAQALQNAETEAQPREVRQRIRERSRQQRDTQEVIDSTRQNIADMLANGMDDKLFWQVDKMAKAFAEKGAKGWRQFCDLIQVEMRKIDPNWDYRETVRLFSGSGRFRPISKAEADVARRQAKQEAQEAIKIRKVVGEEPVPRTGMEYQQPSDLKRRLTKIYEEAKRRYGVTVTDPATQLRSALQARKTYYNNRITDLQWEIANRQKIVRDRTPPPTDPELDTLIAEKNRLEAQKQEIFGSELTDEQRLARMIASGERNLQDWEEKLANAQRGVFDLRTTTRPSLTNDRLNAIRARTEAIREEVQNLKDTNEAYQENLRARDLENAITEYERRTREGDWGFEEPTEKATTPRLDELSRRRDLARAAFQAAKDQSPESLQLALEEAEALGRSLEEKINAGDLATGKRAPATPPDTELGRRLAAQKAENAQLQKVLQQLRNAAKPKKSPEERYNQSLITRKSREYAELQEMEAKGQFKREPKPKQAFTKNAEAERLIAAVNEIKERMDARAKAEELKNRYWWEKTFDWASKFRRFGVLSSPMVLPKLMAAGLQRIIFMPLEDAAGTVLRQIPGVKTIAEKAPMEGAGIKLSTELKGLREAWRNARTDIGSVWSTGKTPLDLAYGKKGKFSYTGESDWDSRLLEVPGRIHGMIKAPVKRAAFERAEAKLEDFYAKQGLDLTDPAVRTKIEAEAYKYGNAAIFLQDNVIAESINAALSDRLQAQTGHTTVGRKLWSTTGRVLLPIVKVPSNIAAETMVYSTGLALAPGRVAGLGLHNVWGAMKKGDRSPMVLAKAFGEGVRNLEPEQADIIMRHLKKGSVGAAVFALGFLNPDNVGGVYQPGEKRKPGDVKWGHVRVFGVDIPPYLMHSPLMEVLQIGATVRRVSRSLWKGQEQGLGYGVLAGALGISEDIPFVREMSELEKLMNPATRHTFVGEQAKSFVVPAAVQKVAEWTDTAPKRKPETVGEHVKTGIPGLRQTVPIDYRARP